MASAKVTSRILFLTLTIVLGWSLASAQSLKLGLKGGLLYLVSTKSSEDVQDKYTRQEGGFGFGPWAPNFGMEVRYTPLRGRVTFAADASYSWLNGNGSASWVEANGNSGGGTDFRSDLFIVSAGAEVNLRSGPVQPYLGVRLLWSHLGDVRQDSRIDPASGFDRFGVGLLGGGTIGLTSSLALDVCARYNFSDISNPKGYNPSFNSLNMGVGLLYEVL